MTTFISRAAEALWDPGNEIHVNGFAVNFELDKPDWARATASRDTLALLDDDRVGVVSPNWPPHQSFVMIIGAGRVPLEHVRSFQYTIIAPDDDADHEYGTCAFIEGRWVVMDDQGGYVEYPGPSVAEAMRLKEKPLRTYPDRIG